MRQSPCSSTITFARVRASQTSAASYGLCATIASGRCSRARRRTRSGSSDVEEQPVEQPQAGRRGGTCRRPARARSRRSRARAGRTASRSASNFRSQARRERQLVARARDEEQTRASQHRVDDGAHVVGVLLGRRSPARAPRRGLAEPARQLAVDRAPARSRRRAPRASPSSTSSPLTPSLDDVRDPAGARADDRRGRAGTPPRDARQALRRRRQHERARASSAARDLRGLEPSVPPRAAPHEPSADRRPACPVPTRCSRASGTRAATSRHAAASAVDVLVPLEHADEEHARLLRHRHARAR